VFAGPATAYTDAISKQLFAPDAYVETVLTTKGKLSDAPSQGEY
jgi:hypothetical protein